MGESGKNTKSGGGDNNRKPQQSFSRNKSKSGNQSGYKNNNGRGQQNKIKRRGECAELGENVYFIADARQADNYVKVTEAILNYIQRTYTHGSDTKKALEDGQAFDFDSIKPTTQLVSSSSSSGSGSSTPSPAAGTSPLVGGTRFAIPTVTTAMSEVDKMIIQAEVKQFVEHKAKYVDNMNKAYALILGQCTLGLKGKLEGRKDWANIDDPIKLLRAIKELTHNYQDSKYPIASIYKSIKTFINIKQDEKESAADFVKRFRNARDIMEAQHGKLSMKKYIQTHQNYDENNEALCKQMSEEAYEKFVAYTYILAASQNKAGKLEEDLANNYALGNDTYPDHLSEAINAVINYKNYVNNPNHPAKKRQAKRAEENKNESTAQSFAQTNKQNDKLKNVKCFNCGEKGHIATKCPKRDNTLSGSANVQAQEATVVAEAEKAPSETTNAWSNLNIAFISEQGEEAHQAQVHFNYNQVHEIMRTWVLLDNESTTDIFCDARVVKNIRRVRETLRLHTNGGVLVTNTKADLPGYGTVWFDERAITNILSLSNVKKKRRIVYDSENGDTFEVINKNGDKLKFGPSEHGLYYYDLNKTEGFSMLQTVQENRFPYSARQFERAKIARDVYHAIGNPSISDYKNIIKTNGLRNCPVTIEDINIAEKIFGKDVSTLKGKTTRKKPNVVINDYIEVPEELKQAQRDIELCIDIMYIQSQMFFVTVSKHIKYITIDPLAERSRKLVFLTLDKVFRVYNQADFSIKTVHGDPEFGFLRDPMMNLDIEMVIDDNRNEIPDPEVNIMAAQEHVSDIERVIRVIKERYQSLWHRLPYKAIPLVMIQEAANLVVRWLNAFPPKGGISKEYSPRIIMGQRPLDYDKHCKYAFGSYCQASQENVPTNTPNPRTIGAIYLSALDNVQGGHRLLSLSTARVITRAHVNEVPITKDVIDRVKFLAKKDDIKPDLKFKNRIGEIIPDYATDDDLIAGVNAENNEEHQDDEPQPQDDDNNDQEEDDEFEIQNQGDNLITGVHEAPEEPDEPEAQIEPAEESAEEEGNNEDSNQDQHQQQIRRSTRVRKPATYLSPTVKGQTHNDVSHILVQSSDKIIHYTEETAHVIARIITRINELSIDKESFLQVFGVEKGIKVFGEKGKQAAYGEIQQMHERGSFIPIDIRKVTPEQRKEILNIITFLIEKRDGTIKARSVADGSKQRIWMSKEETASPTVALESIMMTSVIDAYENRDVAIVDIPNAFIQTPHVGRKVIIKIRGKLAIILCSCAPHIYKPYVTLEREQPTLYVQAEKAIYGLLESALLFYKKLKKDITEIGFRINPYDPCVANMMVEGHQMTLTWHVDDMKISHKDPEMVSSFIDWMKMKYENIKLDAKVKVSRGKVHDYLGIEIDYTTPGQVRMNMQRYVEKMIDRFPYKSNLKAGVRTPAADHLFKVSKSAKKLSEKMKEIFHTTVAQALFLSLRSRIDIQLPVAFLTTRVKEPDNDDWHKLIRMMSYLRRYKFLSTILSKDKANVSRWFADAAYAVHNNMKSHTGYVMTLGKGAVQSKSIKQKLNTKSSTEAELVAADEASSPLLWSKWFMEEQGYNTDQTIMYQDNKSAILLEQNGKESSSKRTRHINIRYFYITDCVKRKEFQIQYCPTDDMWADFLTKPLQGKKFMKFRSILMNLEKPEEVEKIADKMEAESCDLRNSGGDPGRKNSAVKNSARPE